MAKSRLNADSLGEAEYRQGAIERLEEARQLLRAEHFGGSIYLAGRAVEGMLRALAWKTDTDIREGKKTLDTGHDLRQLLTLVRDLGVLQKPGDDALGVRVQEIGRLWFNNMRFASSRFIERRWRSAGAIHKRRTLKQASAAFYDDCLAIIKRCEAIWQH